MFSAPILQSGGSSQVRADQCAVCGGTAVAGTAVRVGEFRLRVCDQCGSWTAWPRPSTAEQAAFHDSAEYFDHPYLVYRRAYTRTIEGRCADTFARIGKVLDLSRLRGQRILDIGCDTGQFVAAAAARFECVPVGLDVAHRAVAQARARNIEALVGTLESAPPELANFLVITAIDLIEHVAEPRLFFRSLRDRLQPGGVAYVETPNLQSWIYRTGRLLCRLTGGVPSGVFRRLFPTEHIQYFSRDGLNCLAASCGLQTVCIESRPLPGGEIAVGALTRLGLAPLQMMDRLTDDMALIWAILQKPDESRESPGASGRLE